jgi:quinol monooxygenase YgiN
MRKQLALAFALVLGSIAMAWAQPYPSRAITLVVPFGAGGPADTIGRIVADGMREPLGQPIIVENVVGASGTIGVGRVAAAPADGYTSVLGNWATHVLNGAMFSLRYDLRADFESVALVSNDPLLIVARKNVPANDLKEFIAWLKANPDQATLVPPDQADNFLEGFEKQFAIMRKQPGLISAQLHRGIAGSSLFMNYIVWESVEAFRRGYELPEFQTQLKQ